MTAALDLRVRGGDQPLAGPLRHPAVTRGQRAATLILGACLLCLPAFWNGYPLVFSDLLDYLVDGMRIVRRHWPEGGHPPFYGVAIWPLHLEISLWPIVLLQGLIVCHLLSTVLRAVGAPLRGPAFIALIGGMTLFTSLPWYVSHVMPDIFGGILILSVFLIAFRAECLSAGERTYFFVLAVAAAVVHLSFVPVGVAIAALAVGFRLLRRRGGSVPRPAYALLPILVAAGMSAYVSHRFWGNLSGPPNAPPYLLAHVLVDGPGQAYLRRSCGQRSYVLCNYQDMIPDDVEEFMFRSYSPFHAYSEERAIRAEAGSIVAGTAGMFPVATAGAAIRAGLAQLAAFGTEVASLEELPFDGNYNEGGSLADALRDKAPFVWQGYRHSRQHMGELRPERLAWMNAAHAAVVILSAVLTVFAMLRSAGARDWTLVQFLAVIWTGLLTNAFVTGAAVGVFGRFGARVIWLLPFAAVAACLVLLRRGATVRGPAEVAP